MTPDEARVLFSDYLDKTLDSATRDKLQEYLASSPDIAAELIAFERTLTLLHRLPAHEPSLDLWGEFAPKFAAFQAERKLSLAARLRLSWKAMLSELSTGAILWTHALAGRTHARFERYMLHDPMPGYSADIRRDGR